MRATCGDSFVHDGAEECDSLADLSCTSTCRSVCDPDTNEGCFGLTRICTELGPEQGNVCVPCVHARDLIVDPGCTGSRPICLGAGLNAQCVECVNDVGCPNGRRCIDNFCGSSCQQGPSDCPAEEICGSPVLTHMCVEQEDIRARQFVCANQPTNYVGSAQRADGIGRTCPVNRKNLFHKQSARELRWECSMASSGAFVRGYQAG